MPSDSWCEIEMGENYGTDQSQGTTEGSILLCDRLEIFPLRSIFTVLSVNAKAHRRNRHVELE